MIAAYRAGAVLAAACASLCSACARLRRQPTGPATVVFTNESPHRVDVYALSRSSGGVRIGSVMSGRTDTLAVPGGVVGGAVTIDARGLDASTASSSGPITLMAGDWVRLVQLVDERALLVLPLRMP